MHVGGLPETFSSREKKQVLHLPETVASPNFVGCMKNVSAFTYLSKEMISVYDQIGYNLVQSPWEDKKIMV